MQRGNQIFAICDTENEYAFRFMEYISRKQNLMFEIRAFTSVERLVKFAQEEPIEILLISERSMCGDVAQLPVRKLVILAERYQDPACGDYQCVYKYQSCDAAVQEIMEKYGEETDADRPEVVRARRMEVYGVYSPAHYAQQMLFSVSLGLSLAERKSVLYLNLETFSGLEAIAGPDGGRTLSDLLYLFRRSGSRAMHHLGSMVRHADAMDYILPVRTPSDYMEVTGEEWIRLFESLAEGSGYDTLILDIGQGIPDAVLLLAYCSQIYLPAAKDALSEARVREFRELLSETDNGAINERIRVVYPPDAQIRPGGLEQLKWGELGAFTGSLCSHG